MVQLCVHSTHLITNLSTTKNKYKTDEVKVLIKETETVCTCTTKRKLGRVPQKTPKNYYSLRHRHEFGVTVNFYIVFIQLHALLMSSLNRHLN